MSGSINLSHIPKSRTTHTTQTFQQQQQTCNFYAYFLPRSIEIVPCCRLCLSRRSQFRNTNRCGSQLVNSTTRFRLSWDELSRLSTTTTLLYSGSDNSSTQVCDPMYPAPPVTKTVREEAVAAKEATVRGTKPWLPNSKGSSSITANTQYDDDSQWPLP
jgi:hypothetical protein